MAEPRRMRFTRTAEAVLRSASRLARDRLQLEIAVPNVVEALLGVPAIVGTLRASGVDVRALAIDVARAVQALPTQGQVDLAAGAYRADARTRAVAPGFGTAFRQMMVWLTLGPFDAADAFALLCGAVDYDGSDGGGSWFRRRGRRDVSPWQHALRVRRAAIADRITHARIAYGLRADERWWNPGDASPVVVLHDDDLTPLDFVVETLIHHLGFTAARAYVVTYLVHGTGASVIAQAPRAEAESLVERVVSAARTAGHPLRASVAEPPTLGHADVGDARDPDGVLWPFAAALSRLDCGATRVLLAAEADAARHGHDQVLEPHVVLALLEVASVQRVLQRCGVDLDVVRASAEVHVGSVAAGSGAARPGRALCGMIDRAYWSAPMSHGIDTLALLLAIRGDDGGVLRWFRRKQQPEEAWRTLGGVPRGLLVRAVQDVRSAEAASGGMAEARHGEGEVAVVVHDNDVTPFDFVMAMLVREASCTTLQAAVLTAKVSRQGRAVIGYRPTAQAHAWTERLAAVARAAGYPLRVSMEAG